MDANMMGLRFDELSIVYMQIFSVEQKPGEKLISDLLLKDASGHVECDDSAIDGQIFIFDPTHRPVNRYKLTGFDFSVNLEDPYPVTVSGHIFVELSVFFNKTVSVTYRMVINGDYCKKTELLTTDHVIELISLQLGAEHWNGDDNAETATNINLEIHDVHVENLMLTRAGRWIKPKGNPETLDVMKSGNALTEACLRYKKCILRACRDISFDHKYLKHLEENGLFRSRMHDMNYAFVDVWESIKHYDNLFSTLIEEDIIKHIYEEHKKEMVGLMSLYPAEWPYRTEESFDDVCGSNVAIDTDDLILVNDNMCVVFGTYGLRGGKESPTDWAEHLKERNHFHVSWPEYMLILEMILAKKYTLMYAEDILLDSVLEGEAYSNPQAAITTNASLNLEITKLLMQLDAIKYSKFVSHKIMFERTMKRLSIEEESEKLENMMERIDNSLNNISEQRTMKQGTMLNIILGGISVASLFEIVFMDLHIPFLTKLGIRSDRISTGIVGITIFIIFVGLMTLMIFMLKDEKDRHRHAKRKR